jgi:hypothetical protein
VVPISWDPEVCISIVGPHDFCSENDIPSAVLVWVFLPYLPLHCWNDETIHNVGNTLGKYIDRAEPKDGMQACAFICMEVDLEKGLSEVVRLTLDNWSYLQPIDCEQLLFKCKAYHEYNTLSRTLSRIAPNQCPGNAQL